MVLTEIEISFTHFNYFDLGVNSEEFARGERQIETVCLSALKHWDDGTNNLMKTK